MIIQMINMSAFSSQTNHHISIWITLTLKYCLLRRSFISTKTLWTPCVRVDLKKSAEDHFWICLATRKLHIPPNIWTTKGSEEFKQRQLWGSAADGSVQHESCSGGAGLVFACLSSSSDLRPLWHGLGEQLPPGFQLPVSPWWGSCCCQELLQWDGRLRPPVVFWVPAHTWDTGVAQWLLVGRHQPCWTGVVGTVLCSWVNLIDLLTPSLGFIWLLQLHGYIK